MSARPERYRHRYYKREMPLRLSRSPLARGREHWSAFFSEVSRRGFNGFVVYAGYHPFEHLLDGEGAENGAQAERRAAIRDRFNTVLAMAREHGLRTFLQHYVSHFPAWVAARIGLALGEKEARLAGVRHPAVRDYHRWCYSEIFRQCPDLTGLYFNYESANNAADIVEDTAVWAGNRMKRRPVFFHRLWGFNAAALMRGLVRAYEGESILGHKICDTKDTYTFPAADSRIRDWRERVPGVDFVYIVGPCHNCACNLARGAWSDYDFVRRLLADAEGKGCDGFSFHQVNDAASGENLLGRLNVLHLEAMSDHLAGLARDRAGRVEALRASLRCRAEEADAIHEALEAASRPIPLAYQQFCMDSAYDGFLNPGRFTATQEPFYYYPVTELNDQTRAGWSSLRADQSWLRKDKPAPVVPRAYMGYLVDHVNPARRGTVRLSPTEVADAIEADASLATDAMQRLREGGGAWWGRWGRRCEMYLEANLLGARRLAGDMRAALSGYRLYFARNRREACAAVRSALTALRAEAALPRPRFPRGVRQWYPGGDADAAVERMERLAGYIETMDVPFGAFRAFAESRAAFNDIRRFCRPFRLHGEQVIARVRVQLRKALRLACMARQRVGGMPHEQRVAAWICYLERELAMTRSPRASCGFERDRAACLRLVWDNAFRTGEDYVDDFLGFFEPRDYLRTDDLCAAVWRTGEGLRVTLTERGVDMKERKALWRRNRRSDDLSHFLRVSVDVVGDGREVVMRQVLPMGWGAYRTGYCIPDGDYMLSMLREPLPAAGELTWEEGDDWYRAGCILPFDELGGRPGSGAEWGFNVTASTPLARNRQHTWAAQYDAGLGNPYRFGRLCIV